MFYRPKFSDFIFPQRLIIIYFLVSRYFMCILYLKLSQISRPNLILKGFKLLDLPKFAEVLQEIFHISISKALYLG